MKNSFHRLAAFALIGSFLVDPSLAAGAAETHDVLVLNTNSSAAVLRPVFDAQGLELSVLWMNHLMQRVVPLAYRVRSLVPRFPWIPAAMMAAIDVDAGSILPTIPILFEQQRYRDVMTSCSALMSEKQFDRYAAQLISVVPLWVYSMYQSDMSLKEQQDILRPVANWLNRQEEGVRLELESMDEESPTKSLSRLGLGIVYSVAAASSQASKNYKAAISSAQRGVDLLPNDDELRSIPEGQRLTALRHDTEGNAYWYARRAQIEIWKTDYENQGLEKIIEFSRRGMLAYDRGTVDRYDINERRWLTRINVAGNSLILAEFKNSDRAAVLSEAKVLLAEVQTLDPDTEWVFGLAGIIHFVEQEYDAALEDFRRSAAEFKRRNLKWNPSIIAPNIRTHLAKNNYREAINLYSLLSELTPRDTYDNGRAYFGLAGTYKIGNSERAVNYKNALTSWHKIANPLGLKILGYLGETMRYNDDMFRVSLALGRTDIAVRVAEALEAESSMNAVVHRAATICSMEEKVPANEIPFLRALEAQLPSGLSKQIVVERLAVLTAPKPEADPLVAQTEKWNKLSKIGETKKLIEQVTAFFKDPVWKDKVKTDQKLKFLGEVATAWWKTDEETSALKEDKGAVMSKAPQIVQRIVQEMKAILEKQGADEAADLVYPLHRALTEQLADTLVMWTTLGTAPYQKISGMAVKIPGLFRDVTDASRAMQDAFSRAFIDVYAIFDLEEAHRIATRLGVDPTSNFHLELYPGQPAWSQIQVVFGFTAEEMAGFDILSAIDPSKPLGPEDLAGHKSHLHFNRKSEAAV